ncbi:DsbA family oxidoreductase [Pseudohalioglobus lutimaris]|uniref:Disulfide bond formation protein DsbA n=1 Tax=Pseudohalioglobus lutimaris TaxID=1737061 RepID=A0A2N5X420_9GAMM|nr:DsbA family protein [Pseudohalioglobus lutimaris]PLW69223.1 disulfide bond formation protein DsbA [Pseudohalioglobus lutimaris]
MSTNNSDIIIDYYSDVLCVWAWIAQHRLEQLEKQWGKQIKVQHHFVDIFGDCELKIPQRWGEKDGFENFGKHVRESAAPFEMATVHPELWEKNRPRSSAQAHLLLCAVSLTNSAEAMAATALRIRRAFFCEAQNVSNMDLLLDLAEEQGSARDSILAALNDGSAIAALMSDLCRAKELGVNGSPTWILNSGRQVLYGNVGYRILNANIEELLKHPADEASWC